MRTDESVEPVRRRDGAATRRQAQQVALELFTRQGYEATSLREIAGLLGINKASLYYHFPNKEAILRSLFQDRGSEADELTEWVDQQPRTPGLLEEAVLRWVGTFSSEKLTGIRFVKANPLLGRVLNDTGSDHVVVPLKRLADALAALLPEQTPERVLLVRMALLSINAAVEAAAGTDLPDERIIDTARTAATTVIRQAQAR